jgi:two-component system NarL family sensor kinase
VNDDLTILLLGTLGMLTMIGALLFFAYLYQQKMTRKQREMGEIEQLLKREELKSAYALLEGQENERQRIAQDLHDGIGGALSTIRIYLDLLQSEKMAYPREELIGKLQHLTDEVITNIRDVAHNLHHSALTYFGLEKAIGHLCGAVQESSGIRVKCHVSIHRPLSQPLVHDIYKIIQELLNNALKHAKASTILIELTALGNEVNLIFEDNGAGFNANNETRGMGLRNLTVRTQRYGGRLTVEAAPGKGASFIIEIPLEHDR